MSRIDPTRSRAGFQTASTSIPARTSSGATSPRRCRKPPSLVPSSRITAGICGSSSGCMSHVTWQIENVSTLPVCGTSVHPSVGRKHRSQNLRGRHERAAARDAGRREDPLLAQAVEERADRLARVPLVAARPVVVRPRRSPSGTPGRRATSPAGCERRRLRGRRERPAVVPHHDDGPDLHQVAPRLRDAALGRARDLPGPRLAAELPEELGDLHQPGGRDRVPDPEQPAGGTAREVPVPGGHAGGRRLGRLPPVEQQQSLEVVQLLVVERVVRLGDVDLLAGLVHAGHPVGHPRGVLDVLRVGEIAVRPVRGVEVPADALHPHGTVREPLGRVLRGHHDRDRAVGDRRDVQPLHRPGERLAREHVLDRDVGLPEERGGVVGGVALVLHRHLRDVALVEAVGLHVPLHLQREDPEQVRAERAARGCCRRS